MALFEFALYVSMSVSIGFATPKLRRFMSSVEVLVESEQVEALTAAVFATQIWAAITKTPTRAQVVPAEVIPTAEAATENNGVDYS